MSLDYSGGPSIITRILTGEKGRWGRQIQERRNDDQKESETGRWYNAAFEDGGRGHKPGNAAGF